MILRASITMEFNEDDKRFGRQVIQQLNYDDMKWRTISDPNQEIPVSEALKMMKKLNPTGMAAMYRIQRWEEGQD